MQALVVRGGNVIESPIFPMMCTLQALPARSRLRRSLARDIRILRRQLQSRAARISPSACTA